MRSFWNANTHYHGLVLDALPRGAARVLDVGCGDGILTAEIANAGVGHVLGVDADRAVLDRARTRHAGLNVEWVLGDVLDVPFEPESFDAVVSVAALHPMDAARALPRFAQLVRPGGAVVVIGIADMDWYDVPRSGIGVVTRTLLGLIHGRWHHSAPECWPPPLSYGQIRDLAADVLPGVRYQRLLLNRFSLVWKKPSGR
jgi:2-polyprenyl-3-methyl-5-hydroxy-6-metoxy-1,4-benzoquinol methylase